MNQISCLGHINFTSEAKKMNTGLCSIFTNVINLYTFKTNSPKSNYEARSNTVYILHEKMVLPE